MSTTTEPSPATYRPSPTKNTPNCPISPKTITNLLDTQCINSHANLKQTHSLIIKTGLHQDNYVAGSLVKHYASPKLGSLENALKVFNQVKHPHVFLWNSVIRGFLDNSAPHKAILIYCQMVDKNPRPNKFTFPSLVRACTVARAIEVGLQVHAHVVKFGLGEDDYILSAAIQMYASCGRITEARRLFEKSEEPDAVSCNAMIDGYFKCNDIEAARDLFECMPCRTVGSWNAMISGYAKCGKIEDSRRLFDEMPEKDDISWSAVIDGYIQGGFFKEALATFHDMQREGFRPRKFILSSVLAACANVGALDQGRWIHAYMDRNLVRIDAVLGTSLVDMYAKCGRIDTALGVFEKMKEKEVFSWNAMIGGLAMHGHAEQAIELFSRMQEERLRPNAITFIGVLNACAHAGLVQEGRQYFNSMREVYDVHPGVEHYGCMVDLLGRAGRINEAEDFIRTMPMEPNAAVWGALLGACRIHGNIELGEEIGKLLLELEPQNSGRYVLLSNIYAKAGRWNDVAKVRKIMNNRGIKTIPGSSLIELDGVNHEFVVGDGSHPEMNKIRSMLEEILDKLRLKAYVPDSTQVLFDIDEEEKETALCYHSEKLAIAFGLLNTSPGTPIRIVKNLRVCEDCHSATKIISTVYSREIVVRDRVRYHHFIDGKCTCNDFW